MLVMIILTPSKDVSSSTSRITSGLLVKNIGYLLLYTIRIVMQRSPTRSEVRATTTTANRAVLGLLNPSSFDTLTL